MKKLLLSLLSLLLVFAMVMTLSACGSKSNEPAEPTGNTEVKEPEEIKEPEAPKTLEDFAAADPSILGNFKAGNDSEYITASIKENTLIISYDFSKDTTNGLTEELVKTDLFRDSLKEGLANGSSTFEEVAKSLEDQYGVQGVAVLVEYTWKDYVIYSETYTAPGTDK